jgi:hypothetical protein
VSNARVMPLLQTAGGELAGQPARADSAATRHLCAGVYVDRSFRDLVLRRAHNDPRRRVAPSYGFDLVPVVRHAWRSYLLETAQQLVVAACLVGSVAMGDGVAVLVAMCVVAVCVMVPALVRIASEVARLQAMDVAERWLEPRDPDHGRLRLPGTLPKRKRILKALLAGCVGAVAVPVVAVGPAGASTGDVARSVLAIGAVLVVGAAVVGALRQLQLNALYHTDSLRPTSLTRRETVIDEQQSHPCVIYRRPDARKDTDPLDIPSWEDEPSPFIGGGELVHRWLPPLTVQLLRPGPGDMAQREYTTAPFDAHALVEHLRTALRQLLTDPDVQSLPGLQVRDRIYVTEADISADRSLLRAGLTTLELWRLIDDHRSAAHHFLETSVPIGGGELVTTVLVGVSVKGRCLSLDVATCALTRTPLDYHVIDRFAEHGKGAVLRAVMRAVRTLPVDAGRLWRLLGLPVVLIRAWWAVKDRSLVPRRGVTVGPQVAVREEAAEDWKGAQLDETTIYDHMKIIEQRVLTATEDFLKAHKVDTSVFEKQATNIINSGVLNMGGRTDVHQSAVGTNAQVSQHHYPRPTVEGQGA